MLCRILGGAAGSAAPRLQWPSADNPEAARTAAPCAASATGEDANRRISELQEQIEGRTRQARQEGHREGEAAGRLQAAAALQPVLESAARSIEEIARLRPQLMREAAAELVELSLGIARRILHREISVDSGALEGLVGGALEKLASQEIGRIRVHPELEPGIRRALERKGRGGLQLIADGTLERGSMLVETARGMLDASLETQLAEIGRGLADRMPER